MPSVPENSQPDDPPNTDSVPDFWESVREDLRDRYGGERSDRSAPTDRPASRPDKDDDDYSPEERATLRAADIFYWLMYRGERLPSIGPDLSIYAPFHEDLEAALSMFDAVGGGAAGAEAVTTLWPLIRRKWPALAAALAGRDIRKATQAQTLIRLGFEAELFETSEGQAYARVPINGYHDVLPLAERGAGFPPWLARRFYEETLGHPSTAAMGQAMLWLRGQARYGGRVHDVHTRVAWTEDAI